MKIHHIATIEQGAGSRFWGRSSDTLHHAPDAVGDPVELEPMGEFVRVRFAKRTEDLLVPRSALIIAIEREEQGKK